MKRIILATAMLELFSVTTWAAPIQWAGNNHYYEYFDSAVTWGDAVTAAAAKSFNGMQGYLVTITSADEQAFLMSQNWGLSWAGGSDNGDEGIWTWRTGPEAGQAFSYTNWNCGEPNNCCNGENYLQYNWAGGWNDHGGPGNSGQMNGYVVEFSAAVPEPETYAMLLAGLGIVGAIARRRKRD